MSLEVAALVAVAAISVFVLYKTYETVKKKSNVLQFAGQTAVTIDEVGPAKDGFVLFHGEYWKATSKTAIAQKQKVRIISREGLTLAVEPIEEVS